jgi:uncharacterized protein (UPF0333 family)
MIQKTSRGIIRKITLGSNPLNEGFSYVVGKESIKGSGNIISAIIEDENNYHLFGKIRYDIYHKINKEERIWKSSVDIPVFIEYDSNDDKVLV